MVRKFYTYEDVLNIVENEGYELISKREEIENEKGKVLTKTNITVWCKNEKHEYYTTTLGHFNNKRRCKQCRAEEVGKKKKLTYEYVKTFIETFGYELLSTEYNTNRDDLYMLCPNKTLFICDFNHFKDSEQRCRCKKCVPSLAYKYNIEFVKEYLNYFNYQILDDMYISSNYKMTFVCDGGHKYKATFSDFLQDKRCPYCNGNIKFTYEYVRDYFELFGYTLLENNYKNCKEKMLVKCPKGHIYKVSFDNFKRKKRCPRCKESKGEKRINELFEKYNIDYDKQYRFNNCRFKYTLPFDFYLPQYNICIEYDGQQHYKYGCFNNDLLDLMNIHYRDNIKTNYCQQNNIKLIRIPYWDFDNIENILIKELNL